jgi:hypothetical protein
MGLGKPGRLQVDQLTITVELGPAPDAATPSGEKDGALFQTKGASRRAIRSRNACSTAGQSFSRAGASFRAAFCRDASIGKRRDVLGCQPHAVRLLAWTRLCSRPIWFSRSPRAMHSMNLRNG